MSVDRVSAPANNEGMPSVLLITLLLLTRVPEESAEVVFQKATSALAAGDYGTAEKGFAAVLEKQPTHIGALGDLGVVYSRTMPVAPGKYRLTLWSAETYFGKSNPGGGGVGSRVFNVNCGERALLKNFDIYKEAGAENHAIAKTFRGIDSNPQDKLVLSFVPVRNYACVNASEILPDTQP